MISARSSAVTRDDMGWVMRSAPAGDFLFQELVDALLGHLSGIGEFAVLGRIQHPTVAPDDNDRGYSFGDRIAEAIRQIEVLVEIADVNLNDFKFIFDEVLAAAVQD